MRLRLPEGIRVYAIGDVHGEADMLRALFARIDADLAEHPAQGELVEVMLGDYVDRGPDVPGVIDLARTARPGIARVCLLGNHEDAMLAALADGHRVAEWLTYGAAATFRGYGIEPNRHTRQPRALQGLLQAALPAEHRTFLTGLGLTHRIGDVLFVHAGIRPGVPVDAQDPDDLIWIRHEFLNHRGDLPVHVVHGHTPTDSPEVRRNRTNIDTGAVYGGALTAAVIEGTGVRFLSVRRR